MTTTKESEPNRAARVFRAFLRVLEKLAAPRDPEPPPTLARES